jgi:hypothetical protein
MNRTHGAILSWETDSRSPGQEIPFHENRRFITAFTIGRQ